MAEPGKISDGSETRRQSSDAAGEAAAGSARSEVSSSPDLNASVATMNSLRDNKGDSLRSQNGKDLELFDSAAANPTFELHNDNGAKPVEPASKTLDSLSTALKTAAQANGGQFSRDFVGALGKEMKDRFGIDVKGGPRGVSFFREGDSLGLRFDTSANSFTTINRSGESQSSPPPLQVMQRWLSQPAQPKQGVPGSPVSGDAKIKNDGGAVAPALENGLVQISVRFGGTSKPSNGTGFQVAKDGGKGETIDGERLIATAAHVITPQDGNEFSAKYKFLGNGNSLFARADKDGNGQLTREEIARRGDEPAKDNHAPEAEERRFQADYLLKNFDSIVKLSQQLKPGVEGLTAEGLAEHYKQNVTITIKDQTGIFTARPVLTEEKVDAAVLSISGLTPEQEAAFGDNMPFAAQPAKPTDKVTALGFIGGKLQVREGKVEKFGEGLVQVPVLRANKITDGGMSGGPLLNSKGEVVAHVHGGNSQWSDFVPREHLRELLQRLPPRRTLGK